MADEEYVLESNALLNGHVFCTTGLEPEIWLQTSQKVKSMGGEFDKTLTQNTHYLIVGSRNTSKYEFCVIKRPDVIFLHQSAVFKLFDKWKEGKSLDARAELFAARYSVFSDCLISFTGIARGPKRDQYIDMIERNGGKCMGELNKQVTYLVTERGTTGDKRKYAKIWEIPAVLPEWIHLSTVRGAILPTAWFADDVDPDQIEALAQDIKKKTYAQTKPEYEITLHTSNRLVRPQKRRRAAADNEWGFLKKKREQIDSNSLTAPVLHLDDHQQPDQTSVKRIEHGMKTSVVSKGSHSASTNDIFAGQIFEFYGFDERQLRILEQSVIAHQGQTAGSAQLQPTLTILNADMAPEEASSVMDSRHTSEFFTHWAIERSLHQKCLALDLWGQYVQHRNLYELSKLAIGLSGYTGIELLHLEKLIDILGAQYRPTFTRECDVLICQSESSKKYAFAKQWNIDIVNEKWLWQCATKGELVPLESKELVMDGKSYRGRRVGDLKAQTKSEGAGPTINEPDASSLIHDRRVHSSASNEKVSRPGRRLIGKKAEGTSLSGQSDSMGSEPNIQGRVRLNTNSGTATATPTITTDPYNDNMNGDTTGTIQFIDDDLQHERNKILQALGQPSEQSVPIKAMRPAADLTNKRKLRTRNIIR